MVDQSSPLVLHWFIRHNNYKESITLQNKTKSFKNTKHLFLPIFLFLLLYKAIQTAKWTAIQVATLLTYHKQIDKRTTMKNQNRSAALGRPAMKLLGGGGGGGGGGLQLVCGRPNLALSSALVPQTLSCLVCVEDS